MESLRVGEQRSGAEITGGNRAWLVDLALIALFAVVLRGPALSISIFPIPSTWDESVFILAAREVLLGHLP